MSAVTHAIRYTGPGWDSGTVMYVTPNDLGRDIPHATGYGYCCGCKETLQFPSAAAAKTYMDQKSIPTETHSIIDSVTARKEKDSRATSPTPCEKPKSALTGMTLKG